MEARTERRSEEKVKKSEEVELQEFEDKNWVFRGEIKSMGVIGSLILNYKLLLWSERKLFIILCRRREDERR